MSGLNMNLAILLLHIVTVCTLTLFFLRLGKEGIVAWAAFTAVTANLFVHKQISLFGLTVTCSDALAVGYLLASNLIQEFFGRECAKRTIWISFLLSLSFGILSILHLAYTPSLADTTHSHFEFLLKPLPRMIGASLFSFLIVQLLDLSFFAYIRKKMEGRHLSLRLALSAVLAHGLDSVLFSYLGLYGIVFSIGHVILFSFAIKCLVLVIAIPFLSFSKRMVRT